MIIAIDFDGTICRGKYPNIDGLQPYAKEVINKLYDDGHFLIIWTCRENEMLLKALNWLLENGIKFHRVNDHNPDNLKKYGGNTRKVYAHLYIDDKQVGGLPCWDKIYDEVCLMEANYKAQQQREANNL